MSLSLPTDNEEEISICTHSHLTGELHGKRLGGGGGRQIIFLQKEMGLEAVEKRGSCVDCREVDGSRVFLQRGAVGVGDEIKAKVDTHTKAE